jgi:hypothetical protein
MIAIGHELVAGAGLIAAVLILSCPRSWAALGRAWSQS